MLAAAAALSRETATPILFGVLCHEAWLSARSPSRQRLIRVIACGSAFVPFAIWWAIVSVTWHAAPQPLGANSDLGWPLAGLFSTLRDNLTGTKRWTTNPAGNSLMRSCVVLTLGGLTAFCVATAGRASRLLRVPGFAGLMTGWLVTLALMSLLSAGGPLIGPATYFRALTECWVIGGLLLSYGAPGSMKPLSFGALTFGALTACYANFIIWQLSFWSHIAAPH